MKILVISVHPDDETLGCGGTLLRHKQLNDEISWLILTQADESIGFSNDFIKKREEEIRSVAERYGVNNVYKLGFLTTKLHTYDIIQLINEISKIIDEFRPGIIYMNNRSDVHTDHQVAAKAVISATKSFRHSFIKKILMYECISETEIAPQFPENIFIPNVFSDISDFIDEKISIMNLYKSEVQDMPLPRSLDNIKSLARYRGASCGCNYAEAFMLVREIL